MKFPYPAQDLVPHRDSMLLIDSLTACNGQEGEACATFDAKAIVGNGNLAPSLLGIELIAQTYAAVKGWEAKQNNTDFPGGFLVGIRKFEILAPIPHNEQVTIHVSTVGEFEGFAVVEGALHCKERTLARGKIKLYAPEEA